MRICPRTVFSLCLDKPDTRRIIHFGPPKSIEEYNQQIGRAGRDGLPAYCTMYCNSVDFDKYKDDFYLGNLESNVRTNQEKSIDALRQYSMSEEVCRRATLLKFFGEIPSFGERCGTCDTCQTRKLHADDLDRDFSSRGARLVLYALSVLNGKQGVSVLEKLLKGHEVEAYRYGQRINKQGVKNKLANIREEMTGKKNFPVSYFSKEILPLLVEREFVTLNSQSMKVGGRQVSWSGYNLSSKGYAALNQGPIILPVPVSIRKYEEKEEKAMKKTLLNLEKAGFDVAQIPEAELQEGDGEVLRALNTWYNYLDRLRNNSHTDRIDDLECLKSQIEAWKADIAIQYRIAPAAVLSEHQVLNIAYTAATMTRGYVERDALIAAGVRSGGIDGLVGTINAWIKETRDQTTDESRDEQDVKMILDDNILPGKMWKYFTYRPNKKTGKASWESSFERFNAGEHPQTIAMTPTNGRPIQVATVVGHIIEGVTAGRPTNMRKVAAVSPPPLKSEWQRLESAENQTGMDVTGDPKISGLEGGAFKMLDFLAPIMGESFTCKNYDERTPQEKEYYTHWCNLLKWYMVLRRIEYKPQFDTLESKVIMEA